MAEGHEATGGMGGGLLDPQWVREMAAEVAEVEAELATRFHGRSDPRRPVHSVIVPVQHFDAEIARRWGRMALGHLDEYFPDFVSFAQALELEGYDGLPAANDRRVRVFAELEQDVLTVAPLQMGIFLASSVYRRVLAKLEREPVEELRVDFSTLGDEQDEDAQAERLVQEIARARREGHLPPTVGLGTRPPSADRLPRLLRTLERLLGGLADTEGGVPDDFFVTLPGIVAATQVAVVARGLDRLETALGLGAGSLRLDVVVETPRAILGADGRSPLPALIDAAEGRLRTVHFGNQSYATACDRVTDSRRGGTGDGALHEIVQAAFAGTGVGLADADTHPVPVPPVRQARGAPPLNRRESERNLRTVTRVSKRGYDQIRWAIGRGFYQGWDIHAVQLPVRFGAVYAFYLEHLRDATLGLRRWVDLATQAARRGSDQVVDRDRAQVWASFFQRGLACGALTEDEAVATGLTVDEIVVGSLSSVLDARRRRYREEMGD